MDEVYANGTSAAPSGEVENVWPEVPTRQYVGASVFLFIASGFVFFWVAAPLVNTIHFEGFPKFGSPPSPGTFVSARYDTDWWCVWLLGLNAMIPISLAFAKTNNGIEWYNYIHLFFAGTGLVSNLVVFIILTIRWGLFCNVGISTACIDYRWCCVNFGDAWCPNVLPCSPSVSASELHRNQEMLLHWCFSLVFWVWSAWYLWINDVLKGMGILH
jgi:hypothetical protein